MEMLTTSHVHGLLNSRYVSFTRLLPLQFAHKYQHLSANTTNGTSVPNSGQLLKQINDLQLLVLVHPADVDVHVRREFRLLGAVRALVTRLLAALEMTVSLHVRQPGVPAVALGTVKLFSGHRAVGHNAVGPVGPGHRGYRLLSASWLLHVQEVVLFLYGLPPGLINFLGHGAGLYHIGMHVGRVHGTVDPI